MSILAPSRFDHVLLVAHVHADGAAVNRDIANKTSRSIKH